MSNYKVVEIFNSIQGEGMNIGIASSFIRLAECNLKCSWCDTEFNKWEEMTIAEILDQGLHPVVVITGGEPTLHELYPLASALRDAGHVVCVETNGTGSTEEFREVVNWITCSPKRDAEFMVHPKCQFDELKFVVDDDFTIDEISMDYMYGVEWNHIAIWLQPEESRMKQNLKRCYEYSQEYPRVRVGIQLHKVIGVE